jgi:sortase B
MPNETDPNKNVGKKRPNLVVIIFGFLIVAIIAVAIISAVLSSAVPKDTSTPETDTAVIAVEDVVTTVTTTTVAETTITYPPPDERVASAVAVNSDVVGWISINGTSVDESVLVSPSEEQRDYYLYKDLNKNYLFAGSIYIRPLFENKQTDYFDNEYLVIYGHNMKAGTKFGTLKKYRLDSKYIEKYPIIDISSKYNSYKYVIYAYTNTPVNQPCDFEYWKRTSFTNQKDFDDFHKLLSGRDMIDHDVYDVDVELGDKIIALSTCTTEGYRFVVFARRLRDDETPEQFILTPAE